MKHPGTDDAVFDQVVRFAGDAGLVPIRIEKEQPGYIINTMLVPWMHAALSLVVNGISSHQDVDRTWMICNRGMPPGPLGILDQVGFAVACNVFRLLAAAEPDNPQYQANIDYLEQHFISKGYTGALSGRGFYRYPNPEYLETGFLNPTAT
jgi:3-hydroxybutyryl-CoA dehydrogenase